MPTPKIYLAAGILGIFTFPAFANEPDLLMDNKSDKWSITHKGEFEFDDQDQWKSAIELSHEITDRFEITLIGKTAKPEDESLEYKASKIEGTYLLTDKSYWMKSEVEAGYEMDHLGGADSVDVTLKLKKSVAQWDYTAEPSLSHEVGEKKESGLGAGLKLETYYHFDGYSIGGEYKADFGRLKDHNDFEEQEHYVGPLVSFDIPVYNYDVAVEFGYLAGLTDASTDHVLKYEFEVAF